MSLPANLRVNVGAPFPSLVKATGPVSLAKANGIWSIGLSITGLGVLTSGFDPTTVEIPVYNTFTQSWQQATLQQLVAGGTLQRLVTAAGSILVQPNDRVILVKQAVPAAVNVVLPAAGSRSGVPLTVKDLGGVAFANNITLVPNGVETIDGASSAVINDNFETMTINPITAAGGPAGWWIG